ncbi:MULTISPECIES: hypothetical protein [Pseudomonas]|jgi:hypothetical protein|uniref:Transmembrane protein n=1 Tax=Pseudomonas psychrophila TaxID=122355 RepID=A0A8I1FNU5_9PSED|nr:MULTISPECIES: hypothetical protein [Pseudomonas]KAB0488902.1 hypothetical protein F7Q95_17515 [Pseudomonas psychrophila]KMM97884.1 membrane protein [Pseudomonas psychrophila]KOX63361.1 hypothetical protein AA303_19890 [Pseudomonas psychrophila]MBJ2257916.1 hypothetical protein [Pseudomonas psychrophila]MDY7582782.1 hypothetical protein [Pseudomonas sp. CCI3.1]
MIGTTEHSPAALQDSSGHSGVSWAAIFAGAATAAALSLLLIMLGAGLGFSAVSPWANEGVGAKGLGITAIVWLALTQIIASGMGGYLAGRLRVKWANMHGDEVYFRDTAHGFLSWAVATLVTATLIAGSISSVIGSGVQAGANVASGAASAMSTAAASHADKNTGNSSDYFIDTLFRDDRGTAVSEDAAHGIVTRIFVRSLGNDGQLSGEDRTYLAQIVAQRTNLSQAEAEQRVDQVYAKAHQAVEDAKVKAKEAADTAAKVAAWTTLWMFISLLLGAFFASLCATFGGRQRDAVSYVEHTTKPAVY